MPRNPSPRSLTAARACALWHRREDNQVLRVHRAVRPFADWHALCAEWARTFLSACIQLHSSYGRSSWQCGLPHLPRYPRQRHILLLGRSPGEPIISLELRCWLLYLFPNTCVVIPCQLLPALAGTGPRILLMDNHSAHHNLELHALANANLHLVVYGSIHSPELKEGVSPPA